MKVAIGERVLSMGEVRKITVVIRPILPVAVHVQFPAAEGHKLVLLICLAVQI